MRKQHSWESIAEQLVAYMDFRAKKESMGHQLDKAWYLMHLRAGVQQFFGIRFDRLSGLTSDAQNPAALSEWTALQQ
jgi:hypothetical protein